MEIKPLDLPDFGEFLPKFDLLKLKLSEHLNIARKNAKNKFEKTISDWQQYAKNESSAIKDSIFVVQMIENRFELTDFLKKNWISIYLNARDDNDFLSKAASIYSQENKDKKIFVRGLLHSFEERVERLIYLDSLVEAQNMFQELANQKWHSPLAPKGLQLEIDVYKDLRVELERIDRLLINSNELIELYKEKNSTLENSNSSLKEDLFELNSSLIETNTAIKVSDETLANYKKHHLYFETKIFNNYVFGDNLPELKTLYTYLKKTGAYYDYWGVGFP
ncbi:hypothetical protein EAX61_16185 [Dokdonia sinensis]|uniref:Uncharacterized protein n=1 Tax=Dokdonia sinensis TaxID=2479847 RepID=A0A3M0FU54_9FLAO|nr:hypothetical protein [Dokdonia sinensis]RMB56048.1 hypothetical protein EAX61_16185 [Dokdonia sinensis]